MIDPRVLRKLEVQQALKARGLSQRAIAKEAKVSGASVAEVLNGTYPTATDVGRKTQRRVLTILARRTRRPDLFPELQELKSA